MHIYSNLGKHTTVLQCTLSISDRSSSFLTQPNVSAIFLTEKKNTVNTSTYQIGRLLEQIAHFSSNVRLGLNL
jgi:hypothetical protein